MRRHLYRNMGLLPEAISILISVLSATHTRVANIDSDHKYTVRYSLIRTQPTIGSKKGKEILLKSQ